MIQEYNHIHSYSFIFQDFISSKFIFDISIMSKLTLPVIVDFPIKHGELPVRYVNVVPFWAILTQVYNGSFA